MFYKVVDAILLFVGKENANERKESLLCTSLKKVVT